MLIDRDRINSCKSPGFVMGKIVSPYMYSYHREQFSRIYPKYTKKEVWTM